MERGLEGKVALVTGGSRGIGRAICLEMARQGATVLVNYNGSEQRALETVEAIKSAGAAGEAFQGDVSDDAACRAMIDSILGKYQRVDILVNNAGITRDNLLLRMSEEEFDAVVNTNLKGAFHTIRYLSRNFLKLKGGRIINISSVSGVMGNAGQANYAASKAGIIGLTKSAARELATRNVCVNAIAPGFVETEMTAALGEKVLEKARQSIPMGRMGKPEDIAAMAAFLAGDQAGYITGQVICVDGGMAM